ncbi:MAG: hypothetical protein IBJ19_12350 [Gemmatimonadaceae bacterium]|nr:hypothetical protein [Gemmatimonadaceae bacterium]
MMTHSLLRMARRGSALVLLLTAASANSALGAQAAPSTGGLTAAVGHWTAGVRNAAGGMEAGISADGERWNGRSDAAQIAALARKWFGAADSSFVANAMSNGAFPFAVHEATTSFGDGVLAVDFRLDGGKSDQFAGIMFGLSARGEYYAGRYNTKDGNVAIWTFANGERRVLAKGTGEKQLPLGVWHRLEVRVRGREVQVSVAGHPELTLTHALESPVPGRVGLWVKRDAVTAFRNYGVSPVRKTN